MAHFVADVGGGVGVILGIATRHVVRTARTCFIVGSLSVYIERFLTPHHGLEVLYVQAGSAMDEAGPALIKQLPPVLQAAYNSAGEKNGELPPKLAAVHRPLCCVARC